MDERDARWEINATLIRKGFTHSDSKPDCYAGHIMVGHAPAKIRIEIPDLNFVALPKIEFLDKSSLPLPIVAHLEQGTGLCYADGTLIRLDRFQPGASVLRVLEEAEKTIHKSLSGKVSTEIALEYPLYWKGSNVQVLIPKYKHTEQARLALASEGTASKAILLLGRDQSVPRGYRAGLSAKILQAKTYLTPTSSFIAPRTLGELEIWLAHQSLQTKETFKSVFVVLSRHEVVFFSAPNGWVGCSLRLPPDLEVLFKKGQLRPEFLQKQLARRKQEIELIPYYGSEASLDHVTTRNLNGRTPSLKGKKIALLGCGTIGSHLARFLVQSGAGNSGQFIVIDNQVLVPGNLGRHLLNFADVGKAKASALAEELLRFHPEIVVTPVVADIQNEWSRLTGFDLIVDATGAEMVSEFLNTKALEIREGGGAYNLLHVWLFGNGIAAQSFLNVGEGFGCYRCLRPNLSDPWLNDPRKDVKNVGNISPASCGDGPFLSFSVEAPVLAASLALRAIFDFFAGNPRARLRNHVIDMDQAQKLNDKSPLPHEKCPACRKD